ncbi:MAG: EFR1 family ferrodoxin [Candidatus Wallbacteria bacterium]|nr:EFR1 family ferrodoxin [Candidatus Wallbacteria bacterium]
MKIAIFYFSGTGNTWWAAGQLATRLHDRDCEVTVQSVENPLISDEQLLSRTLSEADQIVLGYPIYCSDAPAPVKDFVKKLPRFAKRKNISIFCTQNSFSGDGDSFLRKTLRHKGLTLRQSIQINMPTNFQVPIPPFSFFPPESGEKLEKMKERANWALSRFADLIVADEKYIQGKNPGYRLFGSLMRWIWKFGIKGLPRHLWADKSRCTRCGLCVESCPVHNILLENELPVFGKKCISCFRCYNFCPACAVNYLKGTLDTGKFLRYHGPVKELTPDKFKD